VAVRTLPLRWLQLLRQDDSLTEKLTE